MPSGLGEKCCQAVGCILFTSRWRRYLALKVYVISDNGGRISRRSNL